MAGDVVWTSKISSIQWTRYPPQNKQQYSLIHCRKRRRCTLSANRDSLPEIRAACSQNFASTSYSEAEIKRKVAKAASLVKRASTLVPYDPANFNLPLAVWKAIRDIPEHNRLDLLGRLSSSDIVSLWQTAGQRYAAQSQDVANTMGPDYSVWNEFPEEPGKMVVFEGKAAALALNRFRKVFFLHPETYQLYGHVDLGRRGLGQLLYPLYYSCNIEQAIFPGSVELTDMQLDYVPLEKLGLSANEVPGGLPPPKQPRWPFSGGLKDYMRAVGPGVFVGRGWKQLPGANDAGKDFLYFILVKQPPNIGSD